MEQELYCFHFNGSTIQDEEMSNMMYTLMELQPHKSMLYTWDDIGTATLMSDIYRSSLRFCPQQKDWYILDRCWVRQSEEGIVIDKLETLLNLLLHYCAEVKHLHPDDTFIDDYKKYIKSIRKYNPMRNILNVLTTMVRINIKDMDTNPYIFNTTNHAYDLRTGKIVQNIDQYNITKKTTCKLPDAVTPICNRWYQYIDEIMSHDKEKAAFLQRALGYSLLGTNREECMFIAYGAKTRNGKGTLFSTINAVLGEDYANAAPTDLICEGKNGHATDLNSPQPVLARLTGTRLVTMAESPRDVRLDAANMKTMTGRDPMVTRGLFESSFTFIPQFTLWLNTNHLPAVTDDTVFSSNRVWVIEFNEHFEGSKQDKDLKEIFSDPQNRPTVLKWLFDGCMDYMRNGLQIPQCVKDATENYKRLHDRIGAFIDECCDVGEGLETQRGEVYTAYRQWCIKPENKYKPLGSTTFYNELAVRGYPAHKRSDWYIEGLKVRVEGSRIPLI